MNLDKPIYTEQNNCQDCYKCVRHCPVKAIKIANNCASIIDELCISCGRCVQVCPVGAKKARCDVDTIKMLIGSGQRVVLSLAPSWTGSFPGITAAAFVAAMQRLGFCAVSETALGAELVNNRTRTMLGGPRRTGISISSACPAVVDLINRHHPELASLIVPVASPLLAHARYLHELMGPDVRIAFAGPCIAKKCEADRCPDRIAASITFGELNEWMLSEGIELERMADTDGSAGFVPVEAVSGAIYPIDGGMVAGIRGGGAVEHVNFMSFSGMEAVRATLDGLQQWQPEHAVFVELMACPGGCLNGPGALGLTSAAMRQGSVLDQSRRKTKLQQPHYELQASTDIVYNHESAAPTAQGSHSPAEIDSALRAVGKLSARDELNCGGCGYDSCREFAIAMLEGKAEQNMCVSYMRRVAHDKATVLLQRMPSGVIMADNHLRVLECNLHVARMLGDEVAAIYEANPGLAGANLEKLVPFHRMFAQVIESANDIIDRDVRVGSRQLKVSIFSIQPHKIVGAIIRDLNNPEVRSDEIISRTRAVIKENLETVQQIAYLLGENTSKTETALHSIVELFQKDDRSHG